MQRPLTNAEVSELKDIVTAYVNRNCVFVCNPEVQYVPELPKGTIPSANGNPCTWQVYLRRLTHSSDMMACVALLITDAITKKNYKFDEFQFAGLETSAIPMISFIQGLIRRYELYVDSFSVRKERKGYGLFNFVDGVPARKDVMILDDIINSGSSVNRVLETALYELDLNPVLDCYCILNLNPEKTVHIFNGFLINVNSIITKNDLNLTYSDSRYWLPEDCQKSVNFRPDYR